MFKLREAVHGSSLLRRLYVFSSSSPRENLNLMKHQNSNNSVARTIYVPVRLHSPADSRWILNLIQKLKAVKKRSSPFKQFRRAGHSAAVLPCSN